jgi:hypothetical protein
MLLSLSNSWAVRFQEHVAVGEHNWLQKLPTERVRDEAVSARLRAGLRPASREFSHPAHKRHSHVLGACVRDD